MSGAPKGEHRQDLFLAALMSQPTVLLAAKQAGISQATSTRWLQDPTFAARYAEARRQGLQEALSFLQQSMLAAVLTLRSMMLDTAARPSTRVQAAGKLLEIGFRAIEFERIDARLEALAAGQEALKHAYTQTAQ
jgi:hypothetical protein